MKVGPAQLNAPRLTSVPGGGEDARLAWLASRGDGHAKRVIAHRLVHRVRRQAQMLLRSTGPEADDASQQALLAVFEAIAQFRGESTLEWWASRIAARTVLRFARRRREDAHKVGWDDGSEGGAIEQAPDSSPPPGIEQEIQHALARLSAVQGEALVLKYAHGFTVEEIAELLEVPTGTVKDRLVTARQRLRELMAKDASAGLRAADGGGGTQGGRR